MQTERKLLIAAKVKFAVLHGICEKAGLNEGMELANYGASEIDKWLIATGGERHGEHHPEIKMRPLTVVVWIHNGIVDDISANFPCEVIKMEYDKTYEPFEENPESAVKWKGDNFSFSIWDLDGDEHEVINELRQGHYDVFRRFNHRALFWGFHHVSAHYGQRIPQD